jgi:hypothetical protein
MEGKLVSISSPGSRKHTPVSVFLRHIEEHSHIAYGIEGSPNCRIEVRPAKKEIDILVLNDLSVPDTTGLRNLNSLQLADGSDHWNCLRLSWSHTPIESYTFACLVVDRVQGQGESLATATDVALAGIRDLLRKERALTREQEVGLFGELLVVDILTDQFGASDAMESWIGPHSEEHDFGLSDSDFEVKTTTSEHRTHWISSSMQLMALGERELRLISIQVTPRSLGWSLTLPELVSQIALKIDNYSGQFWRKLEAVGYFEEDEDLYQTKWALRSDIKEFEINSQFPKITPSELEKIGVNGTEVPEVRYRISLDGKNPATPILNYSNVVNLLKVG